jgi:hypothetical protein
MPGYLAKVQSPPRTRSEPASPRAQRPTTCRGQVRGRHHVRSTGSPFRFYTDAGGDTARRVVLVLPGLDRRRALGQALRHRLPRRVPLDSSPFGWGGVCCSGNRPSFCPASTYRRRAPFPGLPTPRPFVPLHPGVPVVCRAPRRQHSGARSRPRYIHRGHRWPRHSRHERRCHLRAFRCRVVNHYSTWEVLHLAQTCRTIPVLRVSERSIMRVVRDDRTGRGRRTGQSCSPISLTASCRSSTMTWRPSRVGPPCPNGRRFLRCAMSRGESGRSSGHPMAGPSLRQP